MLGKKKPLFFFFFSFYHLCVTFFFCFENKEGERMCSSLIVFFIFGIISCASGLYQFAQVNNITLLIDTDNNQRTLLFCDGAGGDCSSGTSWTSIDTFQNSSSSYSPQTLSEIYDQVHSNQNVRVCILYGSDFSGLGYFYQVEKARLRILKEFNYIVDYRSNVVMANLKQVVKDLVDQNYTIIIGTSSEHGGIYEIYDQYVNCSFLMMDLPWLYSYLNGKTNGMLNFYSFQYFWEARYLGGLIGGLYTKSNETCFIIPDQDPAMIEIINYHYLALNEINPNIKVYGYPINTFANTSLELAAFQKCIKEHPNVDLIAYHTNGNIIPQLATQMGYKVIGYTIEGRILYGENVLVSIQINWYNIFYDFFKKIKTNSLVKNDKIIYSLKNGGYNLGDFSGLVKLNDIRFMADVEYGIANDYYQLNCTNSIKALCKRLGKCDQCLNVSMNQWLNNTNFIIEPSVFLPQKTISFIYISHEKTWLATFFLVLDILVISYFIGPISYLIYNSIKNPKKAYNNNQGFLLMSCIGAVVLVIGSIIIYGTPESWKCQAQIALLSFGFDLFYLPFFVIILRLFIIKNLPISLGTEVMIKTYLLYIAIAVFLCFEGAYIGAWFSTSPFDIKYIVKTNTTEEETYYVDCGHLNTLTGNTFLIVSVFFKMILAFSCWVVSSKVSEIGNNMSAWSDEKKKRFKRMSNVSELNLTIVLTFIILNILSMCLLVIETNVITKFIAISITIYVFVISCTIKIIYRLFNPQKKSTKRERNFMGGEGSSTTTAETISKTSSRMGGEKSNL